MSGRSGKNKMGSKNGGGKRKRNTSTDNDAGQPCIDEHLRQTKKSNIDSSKSSSQEGPASPRAGAQREQSSDSVQSRGTQNWDDCFMAVAFLSKLRSKDPSTQVGACIVNEDRQIVAIGYNGLPVGCSNDDFPWGKEDDLEKYPYICHAEMNAIVNRTSTSYNLKGCTLYTTLSPCTECTKLIIRSGIKKVVWAKEFREAPETKKLVDRTKVYAPNFECNKYQSLLEKSIEIDLNCKNIGRYPEVDVTSVGKEEEESPGKGTLSAEEKGTQPDEGQKRSADLIIKWEDYHMALACLLSWPFHDEDPDTTDDRMGACIVNEERRIVGTGSGSLPNPYGIDPWAVPVQEADTTGRKHVCHAVMNAILNRTIATLKGCTVYTTIFPCNECAKLIIQSGIQKVVFAGNKDMENKAAEKLLYHAGVCFKKYCAWPSDYKKKTKIVMNLKEAADSSAACCMVESD